MKRKCHEVFDGHKKRGVKNERHKSLDKPGGAGKYCVKEAMVCKIRQK